MNADPLFEKYLIEEFYDDYREGATTRRTFIRRVAFITGSMSATIAAMTAVGCTPAELPKPTEPMPEATTPPTVEAAAAATATNTASPTTEARSPLTVKEDDPAVSGSMVSFDNGGTQIMGYLAKPSAAGKHPAILVCHENRGLTPHIKDVARRFAKAGYVALAIDLLSREGGTDSRDRDEIPGLLTGAGTDRHVGDFKAGFAYLETLPEVDDGRIGMTGYCFGGGVTWQTAAAIPELKAGVPFYGPAPDAATSAAKAGAIKAAMLGVYAEQDTRITGAMPDWDKALTAAGVTHQMNVYPGVNHAFHNDTGDRYNEEQATKAWNDTLAWFKKYV